MRSLDPALCEAADALSIELPKLDDAAHITAQRLADAQQAVREYLVDRSASGSGTFDVVAYGSLARQEMSRGSDFDWLVIATGYHPNPEDFSHHKAAAEHARERLGMDRPGSSGIFGTVVGGIELVNTIGLDYDTNLQHSRRILTLEESTSLFNPEQHRELRSAITARYLYDQGYDAGKIPRFLLNDVIRYWRTVAVDYQAKRWDEAEIASGEKWGERLLKLRSTRKLTFAGTLAALFRPAMSHQGPEVEQLVNEWERPPLARLAAWHALLTGDALRALAHVLMLADEFVGLMGQQEVREQAKHVDHPREASTDSALRRAYDATHELDRALTDLFLSSDPVGGSTSPAGWTLADLTKRYLLF